MFYGIDPSLTVLPGKNLYAVRKAFHDNVK